MAEGNAAPDDAGSAAAGHASLAAQLRQLEAFAARNVSEGESVPPQAIEMIAHLREIVQALDGLSASIAEQAARRDPPSASGTTDPARPEGDVV